jgi:hypothetical protein
MTTTTQRRPKPPPSATLRDASARSPFRQAGLHTTPPSQFRGVTRRAPSMHLAVAGASLMPRAAHDWQQLEARAARRGWPDYLAAWHHMDCDRCRWRSWGSASGPPRPPSWLADLDPDRANPLSCEPLKTETSPLALTLHLLSRSRTASTWGSTGACPGADQRRASRRAGADAAGEESRRSQASRCARYARSRSAGGSPGAQVLIIRNLRPDRTERRFHAGVSGRRPGQGGG